MVSRPCDGLRQNRPSSHAEHSDGIRNFKSSLDNEHRQQVRHAYDQQHVGDDVVGTGTGSAFPRGPDGLLVYTPV